MAGGHSQYRLRATPKKSSRLMESQLADYTVDDRASPTPTTPRSRRTPRNRADRRRTRSVVTDSDNEVPAHEVDDGSQPPTSAQPHGGTHQAHRRPPKKARFTEFTYGWVNYEEIPGYLADTRVTRQIHRSALYWLYGVPIQNRQDKTYHFLCKDCHLNKKVNAILKLNGGGDILHHFRARLYRFMEN
ncbi:hypothetical protein EJ04DRAFT_571065 [Polyplosphaeria fusca]|uniref:Uncharacterized protein n=1 Tax=Polyplosphaeria fusca TaxID=682080 RepID=A0A9P4USF1_9PLEO|nr:hypothetical protein EJ04DRAFT_571065 [Polyplosphaeria fusca]